MTRVRALLRLSVLTAAAFAVSCVPVVRAFAAAAPVPSSAALVPAAGGDSLHLAHRLPRLRRPKRPLVVLAPRSSVPVLPSAVSARRLVPSREPSFRAAAFAAPLDHPPS